MINDIPDGLPQLREFLLREFSGIVPPASSGANAEERERNFLSRALAAYAVQKLAKCSKEDAAASIVDGGGDGGIDAIYFARQTTGTLWVVQSKFVASGSGEPDGLEKFRNGLDALLSCELDYFSENDAWQNRIPEIGALLNDGEPLQIRAVFVYSSVHSINAAKIKQFDKLVERYSQGSDYFSHTAYRLPSIVDWMTGADEPIGVPKIEITIHEPGKLNEPYETIYGLVKLEDIVKMYAQFGKQLVAANIRSYKGDTQVNEGILVTLKEKPQLFIYYNNGLTAYCKRLSVVNADRARVEYKRIIAYDFSVVNGAQTLGSINSHVVKENGNPPHGYVFIKLISLEHCENDVEFAQEITRTANYQNRIDAQHFIAQQPYQEEIARSLALSEINYHYKDDVDAPSSDEYNFNLKDATTALACLEQMKDCDFVARVLANRPSLWSLAEDDYADDPVNKSRYSRVFRTDRSARAVWRAVQVQNIVIDRMKDSTRGSIGVRKAFFENARWLLLNVIFLRLKPEEGVDMTITPQEVANINAVTIQYAEVLWTACETLGYVSRQADGGGYDSPRHMKSVFSNSADCVRLRSKMLEILNQR